MSVWWAVAVTCVGCYLLKLSGLAAPRRVLEHPGVRRFAALVPVALLAALIAVQTFGHGQQLHLDGARTAGLAAAVLALLFRAPFLAVLVIAAVVTALTRYFGM
ncbi:AzlD domain-containing protein [Acrocarpospora catenulata]|uniref:AzlD domain-containing protein n=1 Tax=Acrocarpospora catenulata TaxID=2836182 RepID=UPI001BDA8D7A|nr:AzlD domain-containing protein [Acrocarpospora catenulata]